MGLLKLILSYVIVAAHTGPILGLVSIGPVMAVETFFIISGFLSAFVLNNKYTKKGDVKKYIISRFKSIYPAYWLILVLTVLFSIIAWNSNSMIRMHIFSDYDLGIFQLMYIILVNIFLIGQDTLFFLSFTDTFFDPTRNYLGFSHQPAGYIIVPQAWYLAIQMLFYLIAPLLLKDKRRKIVIALILLSLLGRYYFYTQGLSRPPWHYRFWPFEIVFFLLGYISYLVYRKYHKTHFHKLTLPVISCLVFFITIFYQLLPLSELPELKQWIYYIIITVTIPFIFIYMKNNDLDRYLSKLSYGIFLVHILFVDMFYGHIKNPTYFSTFIILLSTISVLGFDQLVLPFIKMIMEKIKFRKLTLSLANLIFKK